MFQDNKEAFTKALFIGIALVCILETAKWGVRASIVHQEMVAEQEILWRGNARYLIRKYNNSKIKWIGYKLSNQDFMSCGGGIVTIQEADRIESTPLQCEKEIPKFWE